MQGLCALLPESPCEDLKQEVRHAIPAITTTKAPFLSLLIGGQFAQWKLQVIEGLLPPGNWKESLKRNGLLSWRRSHRCRC